MNMDEIIEKNEEQLNIRNLYLKLMIILTVGCGFIGIGLWLLL